jgi:hypothetical protein
MYQSVLFGKAAGAGWR